MTVFRVGIPILLCLLCANTNAKVINSDIGTYEKTHTRLATVVNELEFESTSHIFRSRFNGFRDNKHYNDHRDSVLVIPTSSRPDDVTLIVWFHGLGGFSKKTFKRVLKQAKQISDEGHSIAIAIPEMPWSINTRTKRSRQGRIWKYTDDLDNFISENISLLNDWATMSYGLDTGSIRVVFAGHSAGGSALMAAAIEGSLCRLKPTAILWSDASYDHWFQKAWSGCMQDMKTNIHVIVRQWDTPHNRTSDFIDDINHGSVHLHYHVMDRKKWTHGNIGNNALLLSQIFKPGC